MSELQGLVTESASNYDHLELMDTATILESMNNEDKTVPLAVEKTSKSLGEFSGLLIINESFCSSTDHCSC